MVQSIKITANRPSIPHFRVTPFFPNTIKREIVCSHLHPWPQGFLWNPQFKIKLYHNFLSPYSKNLSYILVLCISGKLRSSEFPVYTVYLEKVCVKNAATLCGDRAWGFELVTDHKLHDTFVSTRRKTATKELCFESCLNEVQFTCRFDWFFNI